MFEKSGANLAHAAAVADSISTHAAILRQAAGGRAAASVPRCSQPGSPQTAQSAAFMARRLRFVRIMGSGVKGESSRQK